MVQVKQTMMPLMRPRKSGSRNPKHFLALEELSPYCRGDLGREESIRYLLGHVDTH